MPRIERSEVNHGWLTVHVDANELTVASGKPLPYPTCIGVVRTTGQRDVWCPAAYRPRGYRAAAQAVLDAIPCEPMNLATETQSALQTFWNDWDKAPRAVIRAAFEGLDLEGGSPARIASALANLAINRSAELSCAAKGNAHGVDVYRHAQQLCMKRIPAAVLAAYWRPE